MTASINDYLKLITSEHNTKPNYMAMLALTGQPFVDNQNTAAQLYSLFDVDNAHGDQLDIVGKWVGLSRSVRIPISGVFFSWDTAGLGWDQGQILGPFDPSNQVTQLDDDAYRLVLKAHIAFNFWDGTMPGYKAAMDLAFAGTGANVIMEDLQDMSANIVVTGTTPSALIQQLISQGYFDVKPGGVRINGHYLSSTPGPIFAWDIAPGTSPYFSGLDVGGWAITL